MKRLSAAAILLACIAALDAQTPSPKPLEFDGVSIKPNKSGAPGGGGRGTPDGGMIMVNQMIRSILTFAAPVPVREVRGFPDWVTSERYDITTRPPSGATREQISEMWRTMFADRMKLKAHVEEKEQDAYALVIARSDRRLGPNIKPSSQECLDPRTQHLAAPGTRPPADVATRCGSHMGPTWIELNPVAMDGYASLLGSGLVDRLVVNRTGLNGFFAITLKYSPMLPAGTPRPSGSDDLPNIDTALQEQLGLKLVPDTMKVATLVIDHIERPTPN